jgi:hypothetical protein
VFVRCNDGLGFNEANPVSKAHVIEVRFGEVEAKPAILFSPTSFVPHDEPSTGGTVQSGA